MPVWLMANDSLSKPALKQPSYNHPHFHSGSRKALTREVLLILTNYWKNQLVSNLPVPWNLT